MIPQRKVTFVTLDILPGIAPLAGGYLQSYACADPEIRERWTFEQVVNTPARITPVQLTAAMKKADADVYAFSCYAWNMGLVKTVVSELLAARPDANIILGGPQVMNYAQRYLDPAYEGLVLCNGEGEKTFRNYLKALGTEQPDFSSVKGLSFYHDKCLITTEAEERIKNLDEIPSPFLSGLFDPKIYTGVFLETTRGCPFTCYYCYWGGAIGAKVNKFSEERILAEMTWVAQNHISSVVLIDANWGILKRDVDLSRYIAHCKETFNSPQMVGFSGSKNTPERVAEITKIFHDAGMLLNHTISLQTMQDTTLRMVGRQNIKTEDYMSMQQYLNSNGIGSHIELIWPLPGETLISFAQGIDQLCMAGADMFFCHPLYLINNIELNNRREAYGLVVESSGVAGAEVEVVVQTKDVSYEEYLEGWRFMFATIILYNLRSLYCLAKYLREAGLESYGGLYDAFVQFLKANPDLPLARLVEEATILKSLDPHTLGRIAYYIHCSRTEFDLLLSQFVSSQSWWHDQVAQLYFEVDLLNRPYLFLPNIQQSSFPFRHIRIVDVSADSYTAEIPKESLASIRSFLGTKASFRANCVKINHQQKQFAYWPSAAEEIYWMQSYHSSFAIVQISPSWQSAEEHLNSQALAAVG